MSSVILKRAPIGPNLEDYDRARRRCCRRPHLPVAGRAAGPPWIRASGHNGDIRRAEQRLHGGHIGLQPSGAFLFGNQDGSREAAFSAVPVGRDHLLTNLPHLQTWESGDKPHASEDLHQPFVFQTASAGRNLV
jgi:hypothetical protein